ncbi:MAG: pilus assembly protein [Woeseiaceae bacterium]|nr:pilus assembly protein [Woeseiaceae bacterium]
MTKKSQQGTTTVEFAIVAVAFFTILFGVIEIPRAFFVLNALEEVTRRGARIAAVCPINDPAIRNVALFNATGDGSASVVLPGLSTSDIVVQYLGADGSAIGNPNGNFIDIRYVRVSIANTYRTELAIPFANAFFDAPPFSTTLPRESLGVPRDGVITPC